MEISGFLEQLASDLVASGPAGWLLHFEESERFYMGSDGSLVFPDYDSAAAYVGVLAETLDVIELDLLSPRVDVLSDSLASVVSPYHESITRHDGSAISFGGLVSMLIVRHSGTWKIRNLHWSSPVPTSPDST